MTELAAAILLLLTGLLFSLELRRRRIAEQRLQETLASVEQQVATAVEGAEAARHAAEEASHLKDEFLSTASHELRTPLNAIVGWVHMLQSGALTGEDQRKQAIDAIERNARIQTRLIEDLLDVSRMIKGRVSLTVTPVNLRSIVDAAVETLRPAAVAKQVRVQLDVNDEVLPVIGDEHRLHQVVWNLLTNALKYTESGGRITIATGVDANRAMVQVRDTGEGIDPKFLPHVFEPFRQGASMTMRRGLGLGLAIVRRLVDLHGGRISAESSGVGHGSTFTVWLPLAQATSLPASGAIVEPDFHHLHVLVAEDDADSAAAMTAILRLHGCETQTAGSASECLRITHEWPPDILVCDIGLPDEDGYGLLKRLRSLPEGERVPAIAVTAYSRPEDRAKALEAGFRAHLSKPLDPESLLREISDAIKDRSAA